jgi:2,3-bisphosphoglycerate-dependent phosphoglycerate mutase
MKKLILVRHLLSQWNEENRFNGWVDTPLAEGSEEKAKELAGAIFKTQIDSIYTSRLFRNMDSVARILEYNKKYPLFVHLDGGKMKDWGNFTDLSEDDIPTYVSEKLNERYYGKLQGTNREDIIKKYGEEQFLKWRRGFKTSPPGGESLKDTYDRVIPFYKKYVLKDLKEGKNVLMVLSHNAIRSIVKYIENISDEDIPKVEIPYGGMKEYDF